MNKVFSSSAVVLLLSLYTFAQPDTLWTRVLGGNNDELGRSVVQANDGGYVVAGGTASRGGGAYDVCLIKTDSSGNRLWYRTYGERGDEEGYCVQQTREGGYIITGMIRYYTHYTEDVYLIKTDSNGHQLWSQVFGGNHNQSGKSVQQTYDDGYIIVGKATSLTSNDDVYLIKTDSSGNQQWSRYYDRSDSDEGRSVKQVNDGGYIIAGETGRYPDKDVYLIKTDSLGNQLWSQTFGGDHYDVGTSVEQTFDGGYIVTGVTGLYPDRDAFLIKTDSLGNQQWIRTFGGSGHDCGSSVQQTYDGGYIITGSTTSYGNGISDLHLIKTDPEGYQQWYQTYGGNDRDSGLSVKQTIDGGYIVAGLTVSYSINAYGDIYLIRLGSERLVVNLIPPTPLIIVPAGGGSFNFDAQIINNTNDIISFDAWTEVVLPRGTTYGPLFLRENHTILAGQTINRTDITQYVPGNAPSNIYSYIGNVGDFPFSIISSDSFPFAKLPGDAPPNHNLGWAVYGWDEDEKSQIANRLSIITNFAVSPNPFNATAVARFELRVASRIKLAAYDIAGREVAVLAEGIYPAGTHRAVFDGADLASGVYFIRFSADDHYLTRKLILLK